jgi:hypothetical protein
MTCLVSKLDDCERERWNSDIHGFEWFGQALDRIEAFCDIFQSQVLVTDKSVVDSIRFANMLFATKDDEYRESHRQKAIMSSKFETVDFPNLLKQAVEYVNRLHGVGLAFIKFREAAGVTSHKIELENAELTDIADRDANFIAEHIPRVVLYSERLSTLVESSNVNDDKESYKAWEVETREIISNTRKQLGSRMDNWFKEVFDGGPYQKGDPMKRFMSTETELLVLANRLVPWDDYDDNRILGKTKEQENAYRFFRLHACYVVTKTYFVFSDDLVSMMDRTLQYYKKKRNLYMKAEPSDYMSWRFYHGVVYYGDRVKITTTTTNKESKLVEEKPIVNRRSVKVIAEEMRKQLGLDDVQFLYQRQQTPEESIATQEKIRAQIYDLLNAVKEEEEEIVEVPEEVEEDDDEVGNVDRPALESEQGIEHEHEEND